MTKTLEAKWRIFTPLLSGLICASTSGCAHYYLPASQLESPETIGPGRVAHLEPLTLQSGTDLISPAQTQAQDPVTGKTPDPTLELAPVNYAFGAWVSLTPRLDVGLKIQPYAPLVARAKYQFYGAPETEAGAGNWSAAALAQGGLLFGTAPQSSTTQASAEASSITFYTAQATLLGGYRFARRHVASLAPFFSVAGLSGTPSIAGSGTRYGSSLGYQYGVESLILRAEITWASGSFSQNGTPANSGGWFPGAMLAFQL